MLRFPELREGRFVRRVNRFLAEVELDGTVQACHVKNTGRLRELLIPGAEVWCEVHNDPNRKTKFSLLLVRKDGQLVSIDSQAPNRLAYDYVQSGGLGFVPAQLRREVTHGDSRFDLAFLHNGKPAFLEVKGVTLEDDGVCAFPDAPTERGAKHLKGLTEAAKAGFGAYVLFVIQMADVKYLRPHDERDPAFGAALREAAENGVTVMAMDCAVDIDTMDIRLRVPVKL